MVVIIHTCDIKCEASNSSQLEKDPAVSAAVLGFTFVKRCRLVDLGDSRQKQRFSPFFCLSGLSLDNCFPSCALLMLSIRHLHVLSHLK